MKKKKTKRKPKLRVIPGGKSDNGDSHADQPGSTINEILQQQEQEGREVIKDLHTKYMERRKKYEDAGTPLPPGGMMYLTRQSVLVESTKEFRRALAVRLRVQPEAVSVQMRIVHDGFQPQISVDLPTDWVCPASVLDMKISQNSQQIVERYVREQLEAEQELFEPVLKRRLMELEKYAKGEYEHTNAN
jgi:hypothetical protein